MDSNKPISCILFISFFKISLFQISSSQICSPSSCRQTEPEVRFPFHLPNHQPSACGFPGFNLSCDSSNRTIIDLPNSGKFTVKAIDYTYQNIWINDPRNCLPERLLTLNLSGSQFSGNFFQDFTLFNCTFDYRNYRFAPIPCLSGDNHTVFALSSERAVRFMESRCRLIAKVAVPVERAFFRPVLSSGLDGDVRLAWGSPRCRRCGFRSSNSTVIECLNARRRLPKVVRYTVVVLVVGILPFICIVGMLCFFFRCRHRPPVVEFSVAAVVPELAVTTVTGLDGATIESYPKTVLGESCRLPKPDDNICVICLSEYLPKETLRSVLECRHCFHIDCIDEWLRLNSSCPVCRNSPIG